MFPPEGAQSDSAQGIINAENNKQKEPSARGKTKNRRQPNAEKTARRTTENPELNNRPFSDANKKHSQTPEG